MESSLTTPLQVIHTTVMPHLYTDSFQTLLGQYLSSDLRLQLLVLQILQLIEDYQNLMPPPQGVSTDEVRNETDFTRNTEMLQTQLVNPNLSWKEYDFPTDTETEPGAQRMQDTNFISMGDIGWTPHKNLMQDEIDLSYENLERRKHDIERTQFLESNNNIYFKSEALMERQKILVNQLRLNMINLQQHEMELEKYYERKMGQKTQLIKKVQNQEAIINDLKAQIQTCKNISSSRLIELKKQAREINGLKLSLTGKSSEEILLPNCTNTSLGCLLPNCTNTSLGCLLELRKKDRELQELSSKLENTEAQLEIITSNSVFNLSRFNNSVSETQLLETLLKSNSNLETQLKNCSISFSAILLKLENKSNEVEELTSQVQELASKLKDKDILEVELHNCSNSSLFQSSKLNNEIRNLQGQISELLDKKKELETCFNNYSCIFNLHNQPSAIQFLSSMMRDNDDLKVQLQNCSNEKEEQLSKLTNKSNELQQFTSILSDKERKLDLCTHQSIVLFSELENKTKNLDEQTSKLQDMETQLKNCLSDTSSTLPILNNNTTEITFLISVLKERDLLKAQLQNCSAETMQQISELKNDANEITELRARLRNQDILNSNVQNCSNYLPILNSEINNGTICFEEIYRLLDVQTKLQTCSHNLSSAMLNIDNMTNEIQRLTSTLNSQNNLQSQVQDCYHTLYTTMYNNSREINDLTTKLRDVQSCELQLENSRNISLVLKEELENKTTEIENLKLQNKNYEIQLQNCSNVSYPVYHELTSAWLNITKLGVQLEKCMGDSSVLLNELNNKTNVIQDLTLKLQNGNEVGKQGNECTELVPNLSMELVNKTNYIQDLISKLNAQKTNEYNCSNILTPLLIELKNMTIQVQTLTSMMDNNTLIKNMQWELRQAEQKLEAEQKNILQFLTFLQNHSSEVCDLQSLPKAAAYGQPAVVQAWLNTGVNPDIVDSQGYTALQRATIAGNLQLVKLLVQNGANLTALSSNQFGDLPIHLAVAYGHQNIVVWMLDNGVSVNIRNRLGATSLHSAAHNNRLQIARLLLDRGAEVNAKVINSDNRTPLHEAAAIGSEDLVQLLLDHGADISAVTSDENQTPLHWAEKEGQMRTVQLLILSGADTTARDINGKTPLALAPGYINGIPYPWN